MNRGSLPQTVTGVEGMEKGLFRDGRVFVGGQPAKESLQELAKLGVVAVVNLRTPHEMADKAQVPFDEAAEAARLGMEYVAIPVNGTDYPYAPAVVENLAHALARIPGPVLLHCRTGVRASYLWTAYLVRNGGLDLDAALARGRAMAIPPDPLGQLLGTPLKLVPGGTAP
ncbi:MAG TPA: sulfur transferase domain-containing protein [Thermoanaerobaculaceae bacterium]|nr:sulfur transferase domain-containing protein [Thermoanaerobaculaceae bacterium]